MKKENYRPIILIILIAVVALSATYAYLTIGAEQNTTTTEAGCFEVNYSGQAINEQSLQSTTNYLEGAQSTITLSKNENCDIYNEANIYIHTNEPSATTDLTAADLEKGALKYKILEGETELSEGAITVIGDTKISTVPLTTNEKNYTIYMWIDPTISAGSYNGKTYSGNIYAESIQGSTITE